MKGKIAWILTDKDSGHKELRTDYPEMYEYDPDYEITKIVYFGVEE